MTHPDAPPAEPTCPSCGHPVRRHGSRCFHPLDTPIVEGNVTRFVCPCALSRLTLTEDALTTAQDEIAAIAAAFGNPIALDDCKTLAEKAALCVSTCAKLDVRRAKLQSELTALRASRDALAQDAELGRAVRWFNPTYLETMLADYRAARTAAPDTTTEPSHG